MYFDSFEIEHIPQKLLKRPSYISHDEFVSVHVLKEYNQTKEETKNLKMLSPRIYKYGLYKQRNI